MSKFNNPTKKTLSSRALKLSSLIAILILPLTVGCANKTSNVDTDVKEEPKSNIQPQVNAKIDVASEQATETELNVEVPSENNPVENEQGNANNSTLLCQQTDNELAQLLKNKIKINKALLSATEVNDAFKNTLKNYTQQASSIQCDFPLASTQGLSMRTSDDKNLRIFSWDIDTNGFIHEYAGLYQFKDNQGKVHIQDMVLDALQEDAGDELHVNPSSLVTATLNGKATYMMVSIGVYSDNDVSQVLHAFTINNDTMQLANIINTGSGLKNRIHFDYDWYSVATEQENWASVADKQISPKQLFKYDKPTKTIRFPVIIKTDKYPSGKVTNKFIEYRFDGTYFQRVKN